MTPPCSGDDLRDGLLLDTEFGSKIALQYAADSMPASDLNHLIRRELSASLPFATSDALWMQSETVSVAPPDTLDMPRTAEHRTAFCQHVGCIVGSRPHKQMGRADTDRPVALVQDPEPIRHLPMGDNPCEHVGPEVLSSGVEVSIAGAANGGGPNPAGPEIRAMDRNWPIPINLTPKPGDDVGAILDPHREGSSPGATPRAVTAAPGLRRVNFTSKRYLGV
jgi:hypothetical protein